MKMFSIITVCYNDSELEKTCKSITEQSFQDFEWIVIDGGSNKETIDIFNRYKSRIDYFVSEKDNGVFHAMNKGIAQAGGKYINFMNAGDLFYNKKILERVNSKLIEEVKVDVIYGKAQIDYGNKTTVNIVPENLQLVDLYICSLIHQSIFFKNDLFKKYGLYEEKWKISADWKFNLILAINGVDFAYIDEVISIFNTKGISFTNSELRKKEKKKLLEELFSKQEQINLQAQSKEVFKQKLLNIPKLKEIIDKKRNNAK